MDRKETARKNLEAARAALKIAEEEYIKALVGDVMIATVLPA
jgi:hypothetical protein